MVPVFPETVALATGVVVMVVFNIFLFVCFGFYDDGSKRPFLCQSTTFSCWNLDSYYQISCWTYSWISETKSIINCALHFLL